MNDQSDSLWRYIAGELHGELDEEEKLEYTRLMTNDSNLRKFEKAQKIREALPKVAGINDESRKKSWQKIEGRIRRKRIFRIGSLLKYAAIIVIAFFAGTLFKPHTSPGKEPRYTEITVPFGQMSQLILSDGTRVWLNSGTTFRYPDRFAESNRQVMIEGEAFFIVTKMSGNPFTIQTDDLQIEVLGTSFNLSAYRSDASTTVTLVEGSVSVNDVTGKLIAQLKPGQMATKQKEGKALRISEVNTDFYAAWTEGKIYFENERLAEIALKLERWFNVEIVFKEEALKSYRFSGTILKNKPIHQIMDALQMLAPIGFRYEVKITGKDKITIYQRN